MEGVYRVYLAQGESRNACVLSIHRSCWQSRGRRKQERVPSLTTAEFPEQTARIARATFRKWNVAARLRDELGALYRDEDFPRLFPVTGQPAQPGPHLAKPS